MKNYFSLLLLMAALTINGYAAPKRISELPSKYVTIHDSVKVHYKVWDHETPNAPLQTLCFVHGFGCDMNTWEKQYEGLRNEAGLRLVFIDLPGYGMSDKPHTKYDLALFVHAVDGVLNNINVKPAILVGHSLGTPVCRLAALTTTHIGGLVDIDGVYCFYNNATPEYLKAVEQFGASFDGPQCREVITGFVQSLAGPKTPAWVNGYAMRVMPQTPEYVASSTMHNLIDRNYWPQFAMPLDVEIICTQNSGLEPDNRQKMKALYPQMNYTELTTCGHFIHMEQPEMINKKLKEYAAKVKANGLEDYDFAVRNLEENYAGFKYKTGKERPEAYDTLRYDNDTATPTITGTGTSSLEEWNRVKRELRDSAATAAYSVPELISDLCCWFKDHHLSCTYRSFSTRFPFSKTDYSKMMKAYAPKQLSTRVNDDTWLLRFPTWQGDEAYEKWVAAAVEEYRQSGCSKLIVDLRGNSGGNDGQYAPLLNLLYAKPGVTDGMMLRNTKDNRDRCLELAGDSEWWKELMDKCAADTAAYVTLFEDNRIEKEVDAHRPKQTAVIIDQRVASSSEQLLLELRAVAPDVKLYGKDNTMGCIDVSNVRIARLPHAPNALRIPVTVSKRLTEGRAVIDGVGMAPDVNIDLTLPDTLTDNIDSWVVRVADHMATKGKVIVKHSEESELVSVLCHIGGIDGYVWDDEEISTPAYFAEVDSAFASYKKHPAVLFAKQELLNKGFAWSTPMDFAMKFKLAGGRVVYLDDVEIDDYYDHITQKNEKKLLKLIQKFYNESNFHQFYMAHQALYKECEEAMQKVVDSLDVEWYDRFFGKKENNTFRIIPGLLNGPGNYAIHSKTRDNQNVNAVMGCAGIDEQGKIYYGISYTLPVLIHEFNHSYCNPLNEEYWNEMKDAVTAYFEPNAKFYRSIAYGNPQYMLNETFVEASMIRYLMSHPLDLSGTKYTMPKLIDRYIEIDEVNKKFTMIRDIIDALGVREQNTTLYPTMHDFMPEYVKTVNRSAKKK